MENIINLTKLAELIDEKQPHCICGAKLYGNALRHYGPHIGGYTVEGFTDKRWIYVTCSQCGYDVALHKIEEELIECGAVKPKKETLSDD